MNGKLPLRRHRLMKGWTQVELSRRSGIHNHAISRYEHEEVVPSGPNLQKLAAALEIDANDIDLSYAEAA